MLKLCIENLLFLILLDLPVVPLLLLLDLPLELSLLLPIGVPLLLFFIILVMWWINMMDELARVIVRRIECLW